MCTQPLTLKKSPKELGDPLSLMVPCGQCITCRLQRARHWTVRCTHELHFHDTAAFLTLTYRNSNLKWGFQSPTLLKRDLQLFLKRLRKAFTKTPIRFFACGEYGDISGRPHYHVIIYGVDFSSDRIPKQNLPYPLYTSQKLNKIWGHGDCIIGDVTTLSIAYTARYALKKLTGKLKHTYTDLGIEPEFALMSRNPGLGSAFYNKYHTDIFPHDYCVLDGQHISPPVYYKNKLKLADPELYAELLFSRKEEMEKDPDRNSKKRLHAKHKSAQLKFNNFMRDFE